MGKLMTVKDVADRLNCSESFVYNLLASGALRHYRLGKGQGGKRVSEEQLQDYLSAQEEGGGRRAAPKPPVDPGPASGFTVLDGERLRAAWKGR